MNRQVVEFQPEASEECRPTYDAGHRTALPKRLVRVAFRAAIASLSACTLLVVLRATLRAEEAGEQEPRIEAPARRPQSLGELFLFQPAKYPVGNWKPRGLKFEDVYFEADDGVRLHGWYCPHEKPRAFVLFAHGNAGNLSHRAPLLRLLQGELALSVLIFDYRGYGRSEDTATVEGVLRDARAARKYLAQRARISESDIVLLGRSLGGAVVLQLAAEDGARGLVLESTFCSLREVAEHHYGALLAKLIPAGRLNSAQSIRRYKGPLLQSHGDADTVVPYSLGRKLFDAANEPKRFVRIPGRNHNDPQTAEYYRVLSGFIDSLSSAEGRQ